MKRRWTVLFLIPCLAWAQLPTNEGQENEGESFSFLEQEAVASTKKSPNYCPQCGESLKTYQEKSAKKEIAEAPRAEKKRGGGSMRKVTPQTATQYSDRPRVTHRKPQNSSANVVEKQIPNNEAQTPQMAPSTKKQPPAATAPRMTPQAKKEGMRPQTAPARPQRESLKPVQKNVVQSDSKEVTSLEGELPQKERLKSAGAEERKKRACAYKRKGAERQFKESISSEED